MSFKEHNNRKIANAYAEYITSILLRKFVAEKVASYCGNGRLKIFDGAVGSGQLEQFIRVERIVGIDIQPAAVDAFRENYPDVSEGICRASDAVKNDFDCVVMNPPFSLKLRDQPESTRSAIAATMPYPKKSGVIDECFYAIASQKARYSFFVCFLGVGYRSSEKGLRAFFGNRVAELVTVNGGFEDTQTSVLLVVIDNLKSDSSVIVSEFDCSACIETVPAHAEILSTDTWNIAHKEREREQIDIVKVTAELQALRKRNAEVSQEYDDLVASLMTEEQKRQLLTQ
jgi:predicted RNA methylase